MLCSGHQGAPLSSSPLPSPSQLLVGSHPLNENGHKVSTSVDSARTIEHNKQSEDGISPVKNQQPVVSRVYDDPPRRLKIGQRASRTNHARHDDDVPTFKKPPALESDEETAEVSEHFENPAAQTIQIEASDVLPPKRSRKRKGQTEKLRQGKIKKTFIIKPGSIKDITKPKIFGPPRRTKEDRSPERLLSDAVAKKRAELTPEALANLGLEQATRRRTDWTPVKDQAAPASPMASPSAKTLATTSPIVRLGSILGKYLYAEGHEDDSSCIEATRVCSDELISKRRKIDLVNGISGNSSAVKVSAPATKSTKSKVRTITAKATEGFTVQDDSTTLTLNEYLMPPPKAAIVVKKQKKPRQPAKKSTVRQKKNKESEKTPVLHSPETAMKSTRDQDFVFGTSSQLVREESPTYIREIQRVIKLSETTSEDPIQHISSVQIDLGLPTPLAFTPSKSLWSAAARNDGSILEAECLNLEETPKPDKTSLIPTHTAEDSEVVHTHPTNKDDKEGHNVGEESGIANDAEGGTKQTLEQPDELTQQPPPRSIAEKTLKSRAKSTSSKKKPAANPPVEEMPNFKGFTDVELAKKVRSFGFKKIKGRNAMISILEKCWENQNSNILQELPSNALIPQPNVDAKAAVEVVEPAADVPVKPKSQAKASKPSKAEPVDPLNEPPSDALPKKKRGRPKKDSSDSVAAVKPKRKTKSNNDENADVPDDISDSDPPTPNPPRRRKPTKNPPSLPLSPSRSHRHFSEPFKNSLSREDLDRLFSAITRAVTSQPPTHDIKAPSWHERMLMYDPIIIEDFAAWLNAKGLANVNEDDEVTPLLVKEWCESRSVCCLWRENLRGLPRARW